jgi:hypothetical protein
MPDTGFNAGAGYPVHQTVDGNLTAVDVYNNDQYGIITAREFVGSGAGLTNLPAGTPQLTYLNVTQSPYTADNTGVADSTTTIQAAITAAALTGGTVYLPAGTYKLTSALTLHNYVTILGDSNNGTELNQTSTTAGVFAGQSLIGVTIQDILLNGPSSGTGVGVNFTWNSSQPNENLNFTNMAVQNFGSHGIELANPITSVFINSTCRTNGGRGWYITGVPGGASGTSCSFEACYANDNALDGWYIQTMTYCVLNACAADTNATGYVIAGCGGITLNACGAEGTVAKHSLSGDSFVITEDSASSPSNCIVMNGCWTYENNAVALLITGGSSNITVFSFTENSPLGAATSSISTIAGTDSTIIGYNITTAASLLGDTNTLQAGQLSLYSTAYLSDTNFYGLATFNYGTDTAPTATYSNPTISTGSAVQINTNQDVILYADITTASSFTMTISPNNSTYYTLFANATAVAHSLQSYRIPAGWYVKATFTSADVTWSAVTC